MWTIVICLAIGAVIGLLAGLAKNLETKQRGQALDQVLDSVSDFTPTKKIYGEKNAFIFAVDDARKKILYLPDNYPYIYDYEDIISVELLEDNIVKSRMSTTRTIGGAVLGGLVAGNVGAVVGGLSGASSQRELHSSIVVRILMRNIAGPSLDLTCLDCSTMTMNGQPVGRGDMVYDRTIRIAHDIMNTIKVIIDAVDRAERAPKTVEIPVEKSIADEIEKLAALKEKGLLTEEEFVEQKTKLLNK